MSYAQITLVGRLDRDPETLRCRCVAANGRPDAVDRSAKDRQCSISVCCRDLAVMGATLANAGINPVTGERAIRGEDLAA